MFYNLLIFTLAVYAITFIITKGSIFDKIRPSGELWSCPLCLGFYIGASLFLVFTALGLKLIDTPYKDNTIAIVFCCFIFGAVGSGISYLLSSLVGDNGLNIDSVTEDFTEVL